MGRLIINFDILADASNDITVNNQPMGAITVSNYVTREALAVVSIEDISQITKDSTRYQYLAETDKGEIVPGDTFWVTLNIYGEKDNFFPSTVTSELEVDLSGEVTTSKTVYSAAEPVSYNTVKDSAGASLTARKTEVTNIELAKIVPLKEQLYSYTNFAADLTFTFDDPAAPTTLRGTDGTIEKLIAFRDSTVIPMKEVALELQNNLQFNVYTQIEGLINNLLESYGVS